MNAKKIKNNKIYIWQKNNKNKLYKIIFSNLIKDDIGNCINIEPTHMYSTISCYLKNNIFFDIINKIKKFNINFTVNSFFCSKITNELTVFIKYKIYNNLIKKLNIKYIKQGIIKKIILKKLIIVYSKKNTIINLLTCSKNNIYKKYLINSPEFKCKKMELIIRKIFAKSILKTIISSIIFFNNNHFTILILIKEKNKYKYKKLLNNYNNFIIINLIINKINNKIINNKINLMILPFNKNNIIQKNNII